jgi:hypothetical protein
MTCDSDPDGPNVPSKWNPRISYQPEIENVGFGADARVDPRLSMRGYPPS